MTGWYEQQRHRSRINKESSESYLLELIPAYSGLMGWIENRLSAILADAPITNTADQAKVVISNYAFNLICSGWESVLAGRYEASRDHWRSIVEAPKFLLALTVNPALGSEMLRNRLSVETAIRTIERGLDKELPGLDRATLSEWVARFRRENTTVQSFAHIDLRVAASDYPKTVHGAGTTFHVHPGGAVQELGALDNALYLADGAITLAAALSLVFPEHADYAQDAKDLQEWRATVDACARRVGINI